MYIMFVCRTEDLDECIKSINDLIKSGHLNYRLELQRLGAEMYQVIEEIDQITFPEFMFNKDIYNLKLDNEILYELYSLLLVKDIFV